VADLTDKTITCRDCKTPFTFTAGEQSFFQQQNFTEPTRCKPCRDLKKQQRNGAAATATPPRPVHIVNPEPQPSMGFEPARHSEDRPRRKEVVEIQQRPPRKERRPGNRNYRDYDDED